MAYKSQRNGPLLVIWSQLPPLPRAGLPVFQCAKCSSTLGPCVCPILWLALLPGRCMSLFILLPQCPYLGEAIPEHCTWNCTINTLLSPACPYLLVLSAQLFLCLLSVSSTWLWAPWGQGFCRCLLCYQYLEQNLAQSGTGQEMDGTLKPSNWISKQKAIYKIWAGLRETNKGWWSPWVMKKHLEGLPPWE